MFILVNYGGVLLYALLEHWPVVQKAKNKTEEENKNEGCLFFFNNNK